MRSAAAAAAAGAEVEAAAWVDLWPCSAPHITARAASSKANQGASARQQALVLRGLLRSCCNGCCCARGFLSPVL